MWGWDPSKGEGPVGGSTPTLLPSEAAPSPSPVTQPQPVQVPNVQELKQQIQDQQSLLAHIKETLRENDADRSTKEKQLEMYANKLSQIKNRSKTNQKKTPVHRTPSKSPQRRSLRKSSRERDRDEASGDSSKRLSAQGKMSELKKKLEENKIKFEERTERGITEKRQIETMVEQLRTQVEERDQTIHELQKTMDTPPARPRPQVSTLPRRAKEKPVNISKWTQTLNQESGETDMLVKELEATIVDLQDTVKQQASVIAARTKAVTLLSEDLSKKGKSTLDDLEETRREMRDMQSNFVVVESQFKTELVEKTNRLAELEEQLRSLTSVNEKLTENNLALEAQLRASLADKESLQSSLDQLKASNLDPVGNTSAQVSDLEKKVAELSKELDDSNKLMIRLKLDHKAKLKAANKALENVKEGSDDKAEIHRLSIKVDELESVKGKLDAKVAVLEEEKASLLAHEQRAEELENGIGEKEHEVGSLQQQLASVRDEKQELMQTIEDQNILVDNLNTRIQSFEDSTNMEPFEIPGDAASRQFDISNESVHGQIDSLVQEKKELLEKLKNLSGIAFTESSTFEKIGDGATEPALMASTQHQLSSVVGSSSELFNTEDLLLSLERSLVEEKARNIEYQSRIAELESACDNPWGETTGAFDEMQMKCLSLEQTQLQLFEQCQHLRKENIELSEEKVRRVRAEEEMEAVRAVRASAEALEDRVAALEAVTDARSGADLEYANIVIASKDTELFNLQSALADRTQVLESLKEQLQQALTEAEDRRAELLKQCAEISQLQGRLADAESALQDRQATLSKFHENLSDRDLKIVDLDHHIRAQASGYESRLSELTSEIRSQSDECFHLREELHRLQVALESVMSEAAMTAQERAKADEKLAKVQKALKDEQLRGQDSDVIARERNEALLKAEETEKVLQTTWAERNDLIQSREAIYQRLGETEHALSLMSVERDEAVRRNAEMSESLGNAAVNQDLMTDLKKQIEAKCTEISAKQQELETMTMKAKKLAANLKKKTQTEKELIEQISVLKSERETIVKQLDEGQAIAEKWVSEGNEKETLMRREKDLLADKESLLLQKEDLKQEKHLLLVQIDTLSQEVDALRSQVETVVGERDQCAHDAQSFYTEKSALQALLSQEKERSSETTVKLSRADSEYAALNERLGEVEEKLSSEASEKEAIRVLHEKAIAELNAMKQAFELEEQENGVLTSQRVTMLQEREELIAKAEDLELRLEALDKKNSNLSEKIEKLNLEAVAAKEEENRALLDNIAVLKKEKEVLEQQLAEKNEMLAVNEAKVSGFVRTISDLQIAVANLEEGAARVQEEWTAREENITRDAEHYNSKIALLQKQVNNFNLAFDAEVQKNLALKSELEELKAKLDEKESQISRLSDTNRVQEDKGERKKKKSVTFRTDEADYIKELRGEVASLQKALVESDVAVGELQAALEVKESTDSQLLATPVVEPEATAQTFNVNLFEDPPAADFFTQLSNQSDPFAEDSLTWDDSWGAEGQLEEEHAISKSSQDPDKVVKLESELKALHSEKETVLEDLRVLQVKYSKVIKKLKEQKLVIDRLQGEVLTAKKSSGSGDLDAAIIEELKAEMAKVEGREKEMRKELEGANLEKAALLKRIDVLNAGQERFLELKERQDSEAAVWQHKQAELRAQITDLQSQLLAPSPDESQIVQQNRQLQNLIEGLEWKVSELTEMVEEKEEQLAQLSTHSAEVSAAPVDASAEKVVMLEAELAQVKESGLATIVSLRDVEQQLTMLAAENEALQGILNEQKLNPPSAPAPVAATEPSALSQMFPVSQEKHSSLSTWFPASPEQVFDFPVQTPTSSQHEVTQNASLVEEINLLRDEINKKNREIEKLSNDLDETRLQVEMEKEILKDELRFKEDEVLALVRKLEELEKSYVESKFEIERLLGEGQLRSDSPLEDELTNLRRLIESEKVRHEVVLRARDSELQSLRESLGSVERDWDETQGHNNGTVQQLKSQLRELDAEAARAAEEADIELRELRAECVELRDVCSTRDAEITCLRDQISSLNQALETKEANFTSQQHKEFHGLQEAYEKKFTDLNVLLDEKTKELQQVLHSLSQREAELKSLSHLSQELKEAQQWAASKEAEMSKLTQTSTSLEAELLARDVEVRELRAELLTRDVEIREQLATLQELHQEISQFRNFDKQLLDLRTHHDTSASHQTSGDWSAEESADLSARLQSDLDAALCMLHQRDVRCEELTFELMQLLEERDTLQLRLSTAIRQNEEIRGQMAPVSPGPTTNPQREATGDGEMLHLANKISELHTMGYSRDKSIQDESQQRHRDQMSLLARKTNTHIFDV